MIAILDYRAGNLASVERALKHLDIPCRITDDHEIIRKAERIVFPGVGAAGKAMSDLRELGLDRVLRQRLEAGTPVLGICVGLQVLLDRSEENDTRCLGILPGKATRFPDDLSDENGNPLKIPHMGWNAVHFTRPHPVFESIPAQSEFYFVHSYYPDPAREEHVVATTDYGIRFAAGVCFKNLVAFQFHPEKSGPPGLRLLRNFARWSG